MGNAQIGELLEAQNQHSGKLVEELLFPKKLRF